MRSDEMKVGDRVRVRSHQIETYFGKEGELRYLSQGGNASVRLDGDNYNVPFQETELEVVPLTPHMTRIRELEALVDFLREHPVVTARIDGVRAYLSEFEHRKVTTDEIVEMKEAMGVEMDHPAHDGHAWRLRREFGSIELVIQVPASLCGRQRSSFVLDERLAPAPTGMTMDELTARRDEIVAEVTAADRGGDLQNAPADSPARQPRHPDVAMGGGLVVPGNHPLMSMLTAAVEADKADESVTASAEMNSVVDIIEKPCAQRTLAEEAILADIFGL
jgi:hypothetical protein